MCGDTWGATCGEVASGREAGWHVQYGIYELCFIVDELLVVTVMVDCRVAGRCWYVVAVESWVCRWLGMLQVAGSGGRRLMCRMGVVEGR